MKLTDLASALARLGEHAYHGSRQQYIENTEHLHSTKAKLPGQPSGLSVANVESLQPSRIRMKTKVSLTQGDDGEPHIEFGRRFFSTGSPAEVEIEWDRTDAPEAVARVRDSDTDRMTRDLVKEHDSNGSEPEN